MSRLHREPEEYLKGYGSDEVKEGVPAYNPMRDNDRLPIAIRPAEPQDAGFIYSSWIQAYESQNKDQPKLAVHKMHRPVVSRLMAQAITMVATVEKDRDHLLAWLCAERTSKFLIIHFCYTKEAFKRLGIAKALLKLFGYKPGEPIMASHKGYICKDLRPRYNIKYIPQMQHKGGVDKVKEIYKCK